MNFSDFKNGLEEGKKYSAYLFEGQDAYFSERGLLLLKSKFLDDETLNFSSFNGEETDVDTILSSACSVPFFGNGRITAVKEFYPKADAIKRLSDFFDNLPDGGILVVINQKPFEQLKKAYPFAVIDCDKADVSALVKYVKAECSKLNVKIDGETAKLLVENCSSDMLKIENETHKLMCLVGKDGTVSASDVNENVVSDVEYKIYQLTDYISKKQNDLAFTVIKDLMSKGETSQRLITSIYNYFRRLLHSAISGMDAAELASAFGIKEYAAKMTIKQSACFKKKALKKAVDMLCDADYRIKSGNIDADEALNVCVFNIMS